MPRPKRRFLQMKVPTTVTPKQQCCVVCYSEFTPFTTTNDKWESNMIKMFYNVLDIPSMGASEDGDEEDSVISLPFCPQCHSKICIMSSLRTQLEQIQSQFCTVRDDVAFTIVGTIDRNCRNGPMDFIRQQIYDKWKTKFDDAKKKGDLDAARGLERLAGSLPTGNLALEELRPFKDNSKRGYNRMSRLEALPAPPVDHSASNGVVAIPSNSRLDQLQMIQPQQQQQQQLQQQQQPQPSKRPARAASLGYAQYLLYSQSTSRAKIRRLEALAIRESINHEMPKLTPIANFLQMGPQMAQQQQPQQQQSPISPQKGRGGPGAGMGKVKAAQQKSRIPKNRLAVSTLVNNTSIDGAEYNNTTVQEKRRGSSGKRSLSTEFEPLPSPVATKLPKVQTTKNILKSIKNEPPVKIKLKGGRKPKYQPDPPLHNLPGANLSPDIVTMTSMSDTDLNIPGMDIVGNGLPEMKTKRRRRRADESGLIGDFPCQLCPKIYMNISRLRRHESLCHPSTKQLQCSICPNGFSSMLAYRRHMQNQHHRSLKGTVTQTCPFCKKSFVKQTAYDYHVRKHHDRKGKRVRRTKAEMLSFKLEQAEAEEQAQLLNIVNVDPLQITAEDHEDPNQGLEETEEYQGLEMDGGSILPDSGAGTLDDPVTSAVVKKKPKPNKIFGRKSRKRRAAGLVAAMKRRAGSTGIPVGGDQSENSGLDIKLNSGNEMSLENSISEVKTERTPRRVGFKSRLTTTPTPPVRKSLRRAESFAPKGEPKIHDPGHADDTAPYDDDTVVYNCSVCAMNFPNMDQLETHKETHTQGDNNCKDCEENFRSSEELKAHILKVHPHSTSSTLSTSELITPEVEEPEPEPIEINLEETESASVLPNPEPEAEKSNISTPTPEEPVVVTAEHHQIVIPIASTTVVTADKISPLVSNDDTLPAVEISPVKNVEDLANLKSTTTSVAVVVPTLIESAAKTVITGDQEIEVAPKASDDLSVTDTAVPTSPSPILERTLNSPKKDLSPEKTPVVPAPAPEVASNGNGTLSESTETTTPEEGETPTPCYPTKIVDTVVSVT